MNMPVLVLWSTKKNIYIIERRYTTVYLLYMSHGTCPCQHSLFSNTVQTSWILLWKFQGSSWANLHMHGPVPFAGVGERKNIFIS